MILSRNYYEEDERLFSTGNDELDDILEEVYYSGIEDGYDYAQKEFAELKDVGYDQLKLKQIKDRQKKAAEKKAERAAKKASREKNRFRASGQPIGSRSEAAVRRNSPRYWDSLVGYTAKDAGPRAGYLEAEELAKGASRKFNKWVSYPGLHSNISRKGKLDYSFISDGKEVYIKTPQDFYQHEIKPTQSDYIKKLKRHDKIRKVKRGIKKVVKK